MASLSEIRARLAASENKQGGQSQFSGDNAIYPHWSMDEGSSANYDSFQMDTQKIHSFGQSEHKFVSRSMASKAN